jgi:HPt (histidine-containing phosphotransfer) domain-containing protein
MLGQALDHATLQSLSGLFESSSRDRIRDIAACRADGRFVELAQAAHRLCGSALNVGARRLGVRARTVEQLARQVGAAGAADSVAVSSLDAALSGLDELAEESIAETASWVDSMSATV